MAHSAKTTLTAWERWELASLEEERKDKAAAPEAPSLPTAAELEAIRRAAHEAGFREGYAEGLEAGRKAGHEEGHAAGYAEGRAAALAEAKRLAALAGRVESGLQALEEAVANELLALSVELARAVIRSEIAARPETLRAVILEALERLPQQHATIHLHPEDAALMRNLLGEALQHAGQRIIEDVRLSRGDCLIDAGHAQIDARLATRWRRTLEQIGLAALSQDLATGDEDAP